MMIFTGGLHLWKVKALLHINGQFVEHEGYVATKENSIRDVERQLDASCPIWVNITGSSRVNEAHYLGRMTADPVYEKRGFQ